MQFITIHSAMYVPRITSDECVPMEQSGPVSEWICYDGLVLHRVRTACQGYLKLK